MSGSAFLSESARWNAVKRRDVAADGVFVYAVRTTQIYCRPVCKARLARQANVMFYDTPAEAERAGYRPCKRCKPRLDGSMPEQNAVQRVRAMIEQDEKDEKEEGQGQGQGPGLPLSGGGDGRPSIAVTTPGIRGLTEMARQAGLSKWHFHRVFKEVTGMTPSAYLIRRQQRGGERSSNPASSVDGAGSGSWSHEMAMAATAMTPEPSGLAVAEYAETVSGSAVLLAEPAMEHLVAEHSLPFGLDGLDFNFDDFLVDLDDDIHERGAVSHPP